VQTNIQFEDTVSLTKGRHQLKTGFRFIKVYASPFTNTTTRGGLTFNDNFTNSGPQPSEAPVSHPFCWLSPTWKRNF
jgi:hypothetical protein